jgi:hypothetical protein
MERASEAEFYIFGLARLTNRYTSGRDLISREPLTSRKRVSQERVKEVRHGIPEHRVKSRSARK